MGGMQKLNGESEGKPAEIVAKDFKKCTPARAELSDAKRALFAQWRRRGFPGANETKIPRRANAHPAPLSLAQQQAWFFSQLEPEIPLYNIPVPMRLSGNL